jgi:AraC-like DNA-binding protein
LAERDKNPGRGAPQAPSVVANWARALLQIDPQNLAQRVRGIVLDHLVDGEPTQASVARKLGVGLRTLQRRLAEEETSFADIVAQTRRDLAIAYLREQGWSVTEVAFSLGFADVSSFSRAFRRWTGVSPSQYAARADVDPADA